MKKIARAKVIFVCVGNSCRSPMAEAIAKKLAPDVMEASSAGLTALGEVQKMTKETLLRNGYPVEGLASKQMQRYALETADLVVNMTGRPAIWGFEDTSNVEDWIVEDPYGSDAETYQRIFEDIEKRVAKLAARLRKSTAGDGVAGSAARRRHTARVKGEYK